MATYLSTVPARLPARDAAQSHDRKRNLYLGVGAGLLVVLCWAGWAVATRFAVTTRLRPVDVAFLRYLLASAILSPVLFRHGLGIRQWGVRRIAVLVCGAGLPFALISATGMRFAPASDVGVRHDRDHAGVRGRSFGLARPRAI